MIHFSRNSVPERENATGSRKNWKRGRFPKIYGKFWLLLRLRQGEGEKAERQLCRKFGGEGPRGDGQWGCLHPLPWFGDRENVIPDTPGMVNLCSYGFTILHFRQSCFSAYPPLPLRLRLRMFDPFVRINCRSCKKHSRFSYPQSRVRRGGGALNFGRKSFRRNLSISQISAVKILSELIQIALCFIQVHIFLASKNPGLVNWR